MIMYFSNIILELTDNILAAQAFILFAAGFETSSSTIGFICRELALAPGKFLHLRHYKQV